MEGQMAGRIDLTQGDEGTGALVGDVGPLEGRIDLSQEEGSTAANQGYGTQIGGAGSSTDGLVPFEVMAAMDEVDRIDPRITIPVLWRA
eukprot:10224761-Heterocapsa_arctica.AAC.1